MYTNQTDKQIKELQKYFSTKELMEKEWIRIGKPCAHRVNKNDTHRVDEKEALELLAVKEIGKYPFYGIEFCYEPDVDEIVLTFMEINLEDLD